MKRLIIIGSILAVVAVGLIWFQPQKLFIDETVNEAPVEGTSDVEPSVAPDLASGKFKSLAGEFESLDHGTSGTASIAGSTLRLEDFETENGPDLRVILSVRDGDDYDSDFVDLGPLKGNKGNQNYEIPEGTDLEKYDHAVIWCRRFNSPFGAAHLA